MWSEGFVHKLLKKVMLSVWLPAISLASDQQTTCVFIWSLAVFFEANQNQAQKKTNQPSTQGLSCFPTRSREFATSFSGRRKKFVNSHGCNLCLLFLCSQKWLKNKSPCLGVYFSPEVFQQFSSNSYSIFFFFWQNPIWFLLQNKLVTIETSIFTSLPTVDTFNVL